MFVGISLTMANTAWLTWKENRTQSIQRYFKAFLIHIEDDKTLPGSSHSDALHPISAWSNFQWPGREIFPLRGANTDNACLLSLWPIAKILVLKKVVLLV